MGASIVEVANMDEIERWGERMFTSKTLDEVLDDPSRLGPS